VKSLLTISEMRTNLRTTQGYIEANAEAQVRIVDLV
jgi:hypothetical protein